MATVCGSKICFITQWNKFWRSLGEAGASQVLSKLYEFIWKCNYVWMKSRFQNKSNLVQVSMMRKGKNWKIWNTRNMHKYSAWTSPNCSQCINSSITRCKKIEKIATFLSWHSLLNINYSTLCLIWSAVVWIWHPHNHNAQHISCWIWFIVELSNRFRTHTHCDEKVIYLAVRQQANVRN